MTRRWRTLLLVAGFSVSALARGEMVEFKLPTDTPEANRVFQTNMARYILNGFLAGANDNVTYIAGVLRLDLDHVTDTYREAVKSCRNDQGVLDLAALRRTWQENFLALRGEMGYATLMTESLATFEHNTRFKTWEPDIIKRSDVKEKTRVIYRSPRGLSPRISVAQTHDSETGDLNAPIRETEIAIERGDNSGDWDFFAYDEQGQLQPYSEFPMGRRPSPTICSGCHYDADSGTTSRIMRDFHY